MNILIVTGIFPPDIGGPARYVPEIARALTDKGHRVTVLTLSDELQDNNEIYPFHVVRVPRHLGKLQRIGRVIRMLLVLGRSVDLLFVNGLALEAVLANRILRKPLVMKVVGDMAWERSTSLKGIKDHFDTFQQKRYGWRIELLKILRAWWISQAHHIIVPSHYLAKWVARWGKFKQKITVIYNAVEIPNCLPEVSIPLTTSLRVVTVGRLIPLKRVDGIIRAIRELEGIGLVIVGEGPEMPELKALVQKLGIEDRVYFAGACSKPETLALMASCQIFVINSTHEGLPHVVLEAMALGLPVVATRVGGTPEVVKDGETGILFSVHDDHALLSALRQLVDDEQLRTQMGQKGREWGHKCFNWEQMVDETERVLLEVVNGATLNE